MFCIKKWTKEDQNGSRGSREEAAAVVWAQENGDLGWAQGATGVWRGNQIEDPLESRTDRACVRWGWWGKGVWGRTDLTDVRTTDPHWLMSQNTDSWTILERLVSDP